MPKRLVMQPNGLLAMFSTVVDDFVAYDMTEDEAFDECLNDMGRKDARDKINRAKLDMDPWTGEPFDGGRTDGLNRFRECIETVREAHGVRTAKRREKQLSKLRKG